MFSCKRTRRPGFWFAGPHDKEVTLAKTNTAARTAQQMASASHPVPDHPTDGHRAVATSAEAGLGFVSVPNVISFLRLYAVPVAVWLVLRHDMTAAFWLFVAAGLSDAVDGWLARKQGGTAVGAVLDPMADKALLVSMYVALAVVRILPDWLAILVVFRDVLIVGGVLLLSLLGNAVAVRPLLISKLNTALQLALVAVALFAAAAEATESPLLRTLHVVLIWAVAASTFASGSAYVVTAVKPR